MSVQRRPATPATKDGLLRGSLIAGVLALSSFGLPLTNLASAAEDPSYPEIRNEKLAAEQLEALLREHDGAQLSDVTVTGLLTLPNGLEQLEADHVTFEQGVRADSVEGGEWSFQFSTFEGPLVLSSTRLRELSLRDSQFRSPVDFSYFTAGSLWLNNSTFYDRVNFAYSNIAPPGLRTGCYCLNLYAVLFHDFVDFTSAEAHDINLTQMHSAAPINIDWPFLYAKGYEDDGWLRAYYSIVPNDELIRRTRIYEAQLRFWKSNYEELHRPRDALAVNRELITTRRRFLLRPWHFEWWVTGTLDLLTGYGTRPYRVFLVATMVVVLYALLFERVDAFTPSLRKSERLFWRRFGISLLYSIDTFLPVVSITSPDWPETISTRFRWLQVSERLVGLSLLALAAYGVTRFAI